SRSPCPALNALANHGYLPRSGTKIHFRQLARALHDVYHLSYPLSAFLASAAFVALGQFSDLSLGDLCRHNHIEHDASLAHRDAAPEQEYAPCKCSRGMLERLLSFSSDGKHLTVGDAARARAARERQYARPLDGVHAEIARGEVALVLGIFGGPEQEVPLDVLRTW
ncbi:Cloroperoxidase, partial [Gloeophyllum trabeum ATCC 11539]